MRADGRSADTGRLEPADRAWRVAETLVRVRDSRPQGRDTGAPALIFQIRSEAWRAGGSAPLATAVSLPTAREARPGAQRRDTPGPCSSVSRYGAPGNKNERRPRREERRSFVV